MTQTVAMLNLLPMVEKQLTEGMPVRYPEFAERLQQSMERANVTVTDIKTALKVTYEMARRYSLGQAMPRPEKLSMLASLVKSSSSYLAFGTEQASEEAVSGMPAGAFPVNHSKYRQIPVYGKAMGGFPERIWDEDGNYPAGFSDQFAEVASSDPNAFLVPVEGVSMIPRFNPGEFAMVEPGTEPELEDDVLVRLGDGRTMIKKLLSRRGVVRLGSYNSPEIISSPPEHIVWMYYVAHPVPARKIKQRM